jgi:acetoin utilization protein AcuC
MSHSVVLISGPEIASYGFPHGHPFGPDRHGAFMARLEQSPVAKSLERRPPRQATRAELEYFHTPQYVDRVIELSKRGSGLLDAGDTPAFPGVYEAAACVVGGTLEALAAIVAGPAHRAFIPIGGLHHAARDTAAGFCVFNDCGVAIEAARKLYGIRRVAYVDIDAHHGDGVFYAFETDPDVKFADLHEDGRFLYPGTGSRSETGRGAAAGTKLNIPLPPGADDAAFLEAWREVESYLEATKPELILLQCGADSLGGDPITHLKLTAEAHAHAARRLGELADRCANGRLLAMGGGGYNRANLANAWTRVVEELAA